VPPTLTLNATIVTLTFTSDYAVTAGGFEIEYKVQVETKSTERTTTGINLKTVANCVTLKLCAHVKTV